MFSWNLVSLRGNLSPLQRNYPSSDCFTPVCALLSEDNITSSVSCQHSSSNLSARFTCRSCLGGTLVFPLTITSQWYMGRTSMHDFNGGGCVLGFGGPGRFLIVSYFLNFQVSFRWHYYSRVFQWCLWPFHFSGHIDDKTLDINPILAGVVLSLIHSPVRSILFVTLPIDVVKSSGLVRFVSLFLGSFQPRKQALLTPLLLDNVICKTFCS